MKHFLEIEEIVNDPDFPIYNYAGIAKLFMPELSASTIHAVKHHRVKDEETVESVLKVFRVILKVIRLAKLMEIERIERFVDKITTQKEELIKSKKEELIEA